LIAASTAHAAPCERWYVGGDWAVTEPHNSDKWVGINMRQSETTLSGDASLMDFATKHGDERQDEGHVSGTIDGTLIKFQIKWKKRPWPVNYEGELDYDGPPPAGGPAWRARGATNDGFWKSRTWLADKIKVRCTRAALGPGMDNETDRESPDLSGFDLESTPQGDVRNAYRDRPTGDWAPQLCQNACFANPSCKAWSLEWAGRAQLNLNNIEHQNSICRLKRSVGRPTASLRHVSGVVLGRSPEAALPIPGPSTGQVIATRGMEDGTDRPGLDYHREEMRPDRRNAEECQLQCLRSDRCRAWTYVRPGVQGIAGVCYLKHAVPKAVPNACCVSGVKPSKTGPGGVSEPGPFVPTPPTGSKKTGPGGVSEPGPFVPTPPNRGGGVASEPGGFARVPTSAGCAPPFVQRRARPSDTVCVTRESFATVQDENASASSRWNPNGAYGPNTCIAGFVWREAFDGDTVCVTPERRAAVKEENRLASGRAQ
jgi:hypothetical protein